MNNEQNSEDNIDDIDQDYGDNMVDPKESGGQQEEETLPPPPPPPQSFQTMQKQPSTVEVADDNNDDDLSLSSSSLHLMNPTDSNNHRRDHESRTNRINFKFNNNNNNNINNYNCTNVISNNQSYENDDDELIKSIPIEIEANNTNNSSSLNPEVEINNNKSIISRKIVSNLKKPSNYSTQSRAKVKFSDVELRHLIKNTANNSNEDLAAYFEHKQAPPAMRQRLANECYTMLGRPRPYSTPTIADESDLMLGCIPQHHSYAATAFQLAAVEGDLVANNGINNGAANGLAQPPPPPHHYAARRMLKHSNTVNFLDVASGGSVASSSGGGGFGGGTMTTRPRSMPRSNLVGNSSIYFDMDRLLLLLFLSNKVSISIFFLVGGVVVVH